MSLPAGAVWECRTAGSDINGGAFVAGGAGTDYSQQDTKNTVGNNISTTDAVANGTTTISSATAAFTAALQDNVIYLQGGTGALAAGWYRVASVTSATQIVLDRAVAAGTGITMNIGGALASPGQAALNLVSGNIVWVKAGTYTITATTATSGGCFTTAGSTAWSIYGYNTTRGDNPTGANRPLLQASGIATFTIVSSGTGIGCTARNLIADGAGLTSSRGFHHGGNSTVIFNCDARNCTNSGINGVVWLGRSTATGCSTAAAIISAGNVIACVAYTNTNAGFTTTNGTCQWCIAYNNTGGIGFLGSRFLNCVSYGNSSHGFSIAADAHNCIAVSNGGAGYFNNGGFGLWSCADYNNTSGRLSGPTLALGDNDPISLTGDPFTSAATLDFSLNNITGAGAACRQAGFPGTLTVGGTGFLDLGALQTSGGGGGGSAGYSRSRVVNRQ